MTRQMQWEVLHSVHTPCSSSAKQGEQVKPSNLVVTLCTAVNTSLRTVLTHPLSASREDGEDTGAASQRPLPRGPDGKYGRGKLRHVSACPRAREEGISEQG